MDSVIASFKYKDIASVVKLRDRIRSLDSEAVFERLKTLNLKDISAIVVKLELALSQPTQIFI